MRDGATPVLRVNSAGILAKLGPADISDEVITVLKRDADTRHLYLTAVASRVLALPWDEAGKLAVRGHELTAGKAMAPERAAELAVQLLMRI